MELGPGNARSVTVVEAQERTRVIINLTSMTGYNTRVDGNDLYVVIGDGVTSGPEQAPARISKKETKVAAVRGIKNIDFQRGEEGEGNVIIDLTANAGSPNIQEKGNKIELHFPKAALPDELRVRLDVKDFATPVNFVSAVERAGGTSILIESIGDFDYMAYQADSRMIVTVKPMSKQEKEKRNINRFSYTGEKLSLNFQDIDVRSVLQLIADFTDLNLVASDTVQGNITLRLQNVPWDQALELVLKTKGLAQRKVGNVLMVAPADEIAARERQELEASQQIAELAPLRRELIQVNYAKAAQIAALFQSVTSAQDSGNRGSVTVDERTNNIIAYQTDEKLDELRRIVAQLDIPVRQVLIEARIVEVSESYGKELGVRWGGEINSADGKWTGTGAGGRDGNAFVDLGVAAPSSGIGIGFVSSHVTLDLQLNAM